MTDTSTFFTNRACRYYPCHDLEEINCLFCYCPLYSLPRCPGTYHVVTTKDGRRVKSCIDCTFPHRRENIPEIFRYLKGIGTMSEPTWSDEEKDLESRIQARWDAIAKPIDSLGKFEKLITRIGVIQGTEDMHLNHPALLVFAGDHGVVREGVTQTGSEVTRIVTENFAKGRATTNGLAKDAGCDLFIIDAGMDCEPYPEKHFVQGAVIDRKIRRGTGDIAIEDAMTIDECKAALRAGEEAAEAMQEKGADILAAGEMGIGNTTPSAALIGHFLSRTAEEVTGRGAGLDDAGMERKRRAVSLALTRAEDLTDPVAVLAAIGGCEIAEMCGVYLYCAKHHLPVILDGVISLAAATTAVRIDPTVQKVLIPSHRTREGAGSFVLDALGMEPVLDATLSLGEGSGAMFLVPLLRMALHVYQDDGTFTDSGITPYTPYERLDQKPENQAEGKPEEKR